MTGGRIDSLKPASSAPSARRRFPAWLVFSLLTIVLWGVWGALTKVISADIDAYTNQVFFAIGVLPVMAIVLFSRRLSGGANCKRGFVYAFITGVLGGTGNIAFFMAFSEGREGLGRRPGDLALAPGHGYPGLLYSQREGQRLPESRTRIGDGCHLSVEPVRLL